MLPCTEVDRALFSACTVISIGNGMLTSFWFDRWIDGAAPLDVAPDLFPLARRKKVSVHEALVDDLWMKGLERLNSAGQLRQFFSLWQAVRSLALSQICDSVVWKFNRNGIYSAKSAYECQFLGRVPSPSLQRVWSIKMEGKVRIFLWLLLQNRLWTADRLRDRGWAHGDHCSLCDQVLECGNHLFLRCPYAREVWHLARSNFVGDLQQVCVASSISRWWKCLTVGARSPGRNAAMTFGAYVAWNLWKERNRRIFQGKDVSSPRLLEIISAEIEFFCLAKGL